MSCLNAQTSLPSLTKEHVDLLVAYDGDATPPLSLLVRDSDHAVSYSSNQIVLAVTEASQFTLSSDVPALSLTNGQTIWWLRQTQPPAGTLFLGLAAQSVPSGTFAGPFSVFVTNVAGPGRFFIWQDLSGGGIDLKVDSSDGLDAADVVPISTGHDHFNWAFTATGVYCVTFRADGTLSAGGTVSSLETTFVFHVRPLGIVTPYALWQKAHWLQGTDPAISGPGADPDGDSAPNAIEYSANLNPNVVSTSGLPEFSFVTDGVAEYGALTYTRVKAAADISYEPSVTGQLNGGWDLLTNTVSVTDHGDTETITVRDVTAKADATQRWFQFRVTLSETP